MAVHNRFSTGLPVTLMACVMIGSLLTGGRPVIAKKLASSSASTADKSAAAVDPNEEPSSPEAVEKFSEAASLQNDKKFTKAISHWQKFTKTYKRDPLAGQAHFYLGVCYLELKQHDKAAKQFEIAKKSDNNSEYIEDAYVNLGWCHYWQGLAGDRLSLAHGAVVFRDLLKKFPKTQVADQALFYTAECLYHLGKADDAIDAYAELVDQHEDSPMRPDALYALGVAQLEMERYEPASKSFSVCLDQYPSHPLKSEIELRNADALMELKKFAEAEPLFAAAASVPDSPSADHALYRQAFCATMLKKTGESAKLYAKLVNDFPQSPYVTEAMIAAGRAFYRTGDTNTATAWLDRAIEKGGTHAIEAQHWKNRIAKGEPAGDDFDDITEFRQPDKEGGPRSTLPPLDLLTNDVDSSADSDEVPPTTPVPESDATPAKTQQSSTDWTNDLPVLNGLSDTDAVHKGIAGAHKDRGKKLGDAAKRKGPQALADAIAAMKASDYTSAISIAANFQNQSPADPLVAEILAIQAESLQRDGQTKTASETYQNLFTKHGKHAAAPNWALRRATLLNQLKAYSSAVEALQPFIKRFASEEEVGAAKLQLGVAFLQLNRHQEAADALQDASVKVASSAQAAEALLKLAVAQQEMQQQEQAKATLTTIIEKFSDNASAAQANFELAELYFDAGQWEKALSLYDDVLKKTPKASVVPYCLFGKGWALLRSNQPKAAIAPLSQFIKQYASHELVPAALQTRAMCHQHAGNFIEGLVDVARILESDPVGDARSDALYVRGLCQSGMKQHKEATATLSGILKDNPGYAENDRVLYELGWIAQNRGDVQTASKWFAKLAKQYPDSPAASEAQFRVANSHFARAQYTVALPHYENAMRKIRDVKMKAECLHKLGWCQFQGRDYEAAAATFKEQLTSAADQRFSIEGKFMLAESLLNLKRYKAAMQLYEDLRGVENKTETVAAMTLLHASRCSLESRDWTTAIELAKELIADHPKSKYVRRARLQSGIALTEKRELKNAMLVYQSIVRGDEDAVGAEACYRLGQVQYKMGSYANALEQFEKIVSGFSAKELASSMAVWKPQAALAAGQSAAALARSTRRQAQRASYSAQAEKYLKYVVANYPESTAAQKANAELQRTSAAATRRR